MEAPTFSWNQIGNVEEGRPNLGPYTRVEIYRMQQYSMRVALEEEFGNDVARRLLFSAGRHAGLAFGQAWLQKEVTLNQYLATIQVKLEEFGIGILRVEKVDLENLHIVLTVSEDLDCSGLPVNGTTVCDFDEGFLQGLFYFYTGKNFDVREIDCWSTGDRTCRFAIKQQ